MSDSDHNIRTDTVNFRDWVLGRGEFSEENLRKSRKEFFDKLGKHWGELMLASIEKAFSDHDAVPEAKATKPDSGAADSAIPDCGTGDTQEPVAFGAEYDGKIDFATDDRRHCEDWISSQCRREYMNVVPLYRSPTLTDEEREAVEFFAAIHCDDELLGKHADTLRNLLERLK